MARTYQYRERGGREDAAATYSQANLARSDGNGDGKVKGRAADGETDHVEDVKGQLQPKVERELCGRKRARERARARRLMIATESDSWANEAVSLARWRRRESSHEPGMGTYANETNDPALPSRDDTDGGHRDRREGGDPLPHPSTGGVVGAQERGAEDDADAIDL